MRKYLIDTMESGDHGLFLFDIPTGYGKTYNAAQAMAEYTLRAKNPQRKIIFLTTMNKNLPEKELFAAFGSDSSLYDRYVLRIRSNFDEVTEKLVNLNIPKEFQTDTYFALLALVKQYKRVSSETYASQEYVKDLEKRLSEAETAFHSEIRRKLKKEFRNKHARIDAIRYDRKWEWVGILYPAVFTDDHQILLMSVSKFLMKNTCLVEPSYAFLSAEFIENAIILIDEFDSTKKTIVDKIIDEALSFQEEYLSLFRQLYNGLNPDHFSRPMKSAYEQISSKSTYTFQNIREEADQIIADYHVFLSYKSTDESIDRNQNFILHDGTYHTILQNGKHYIRAAVNDSENKVDIFFETKKEFYANGGNEGLDSRENGNGRGITIFAMLRRINRFLSHFRVFLFTWARNYAQMVNSEIRRPDDDELTLENAVSSILDKIELSPSGRKLILSKMQRSTSRKSQKELLPDNSFYQEGMEVFVLEDNDSHHDSTSLSLIAFYETPEKILIQLCDKATVFGLSATAEVPSAVGNYNLTYLKEYLGGNYHITPINVKDRIKAEMQKNWTSYYDGRIRIHTEPIPGLSDDFDAYSVCGNIFCNDDYAIVCANIILNTSSSDYHAYRYCNIVHAMHLFCSRRIQSFLYLGMALPQKNNPDMDSTLLKHLFDLVITDLQESGSTTCLKMNSEQSLVFLRGDHFDEEKEKVLQKLGEGQKIMIMSSYQTLGAGQNLQYPVPQSGDFIELTPYLNNGDKRHFFKDFDAIYLGDVTNQTVNTYSKNRITLKEMIQMLFQIEELMENGELSYYNGNEMMKLAFGAYTGNGHMTRNLLYRTESVRLQATRFAMQAIGRICRTFIKPRDLYILIEESFLEKISSAELKKHILTPELQMLANMRDALGKEYTDTEERILLRAEKISTFGMWNIRQMLSRDWTPGSMELWKAIREVTLCYPTASLAQMESNALIRKLYITNGVPQKRYFYSQYSDFQDVTIDFGNDREAFRNSGRAKKRADSNKIMIQVMSEEESGLPSLIRYPGLKDYFQSSGYATEFTENDYMMSPVLFHNIYKGALGEVAGKFILEQELGIHLKEIEDPQKFEFFDYILAPDVYVDFKNWKFTYTSKREEVRESISRKLDFIGGKRAYIINVVGNPDAYTPSIPIDHRIIEIPCLIDNKGKPVLRNLKAILKEDLS